MKQFALIMLIFLLAIPAYAADTYFAASAQGVGDGTSCAKAIAIKDGTNGINKVSRWVGDANLIVCNTGGTIVCTDNSTSLVISQGAGTSGHPVNVKGEGGPVLACPMWTSNGAIRLTHQYVLVDGQGSADGPGAFGAGAGSGGLVIENTLAGTAGNTTCLGGTCNVRGGGTFGIYVGAANLTIKNVKCTNIYMHTKNASPDDDEGFNTACINVPSGVDADNVLITHNTMQDVDISSSVAGENIEVSYNFIQNCNRCVGGNPKADTANSSGFLLHHNEIGAGDIWDATNNFYHHSAIVLFNANSTHTWSNLHIYDNYAHGNRGHNITTKGVQCNFSGSGTFANQAYVNVYIYNNIFITESDSGVTAAAALACNAEGMIYANNTVYGVVLADSNGCISFASATSDSFIATPLAIKNNLCRTNAGATAGGGAFTQTIPFPDRTKIDYNIYAGTDTNGGFAAQGGNVNSFTNWQTFNCLGNSGQCGFDANGTNPNVNNDAASAAAVNINPATFIPQVGSILIGAGANLTSSLCGTVAGICLDFYGNARPAMGAWDVGAVNSTATPPATGGADRGRVHR